MALRSEQARVLRRRVLGGLIRNLVLFTGAFALLCGAVQTFVVPSMADYVANSTSSWHTLPSSEQYTQALADEGLSIEDGGIHDMWVDEFVQSGYSADEGTAAKVQDEIDEMQYALGEFLAAEQANDKQAAVDAAAKAVKAAQAQAEKLGLVDPVANASAAGGGVVFDENASAATDKSLFIETAKDGEAPEDTGEKTDAGSGNNAADADSALPPLLDYRTILKAEGIEPDDASAAQARAALRTTATILEMGLSLSASSPHLPPDTTEEDAVRILVAAATVGYAQADLDDLLGRAYRQSQAQAYDAWVALTPAEEAQALGVNDEHPVWQVIQDENGTYSIRDISTYTFIKSFKLPLIVIAFVAGWLFIILRSLNKSLRYFDELSGAVATLLTDKEAPLELPADLSIARNELAVIRSQSLADERAAHAAEQRKNELVAYLAHDIRTPLTSVLGYLDLLRETTDLPRDTLRKYADVAYTKAERLEQLINEFFEITRYNLSAIPIERETVGVRLFCQQVAEAFFPEASARNIRISIDVTGADTFFIDPDKLARALGNVLRNAVAYADANSTIALAARQDGRLTTITVANRGREISEAHLESIFEKFYRADGARTTRSGGAGLGLAIAREIVVAHHGTIEAASERGITVFTLSIPTRGDEEALRGRAGTGASAASIPAAASTSGPISNRPGRLSQRTTAMLHGSRPASARPDRPAALPRQRPAGAPSFMHPGERTEPPRSDAQPAAPGRIGERTATRRGGAAPLKPRYTAAPSAPTASRMNDNRPRSRSRHARRQP